MVRIIRALSFGILSSLNIETTASGRGRVEALPLQRTQRLHEKLGSPSGKAPRGWKESHMQEWQNQSHVKWECKYHMVIVPKYRKKLMYGTLRNQVGPILKELCRQ